MDGNSRNKDLLVVRIEKGVMSEPRKSVNTMTALTKNPP